VRNPHCVEPKLQNGKLLKAETLSKLQ